MIFLKIGVGMLKIVGSTQAIFCVPQLHASAIPVPHLDNGPELTSVAFTEWCAAHGIEVQFIQPGKPDQNAFIERFNKTYRDEVLDAYVFETIEQVREITDDWLSEYNEERPRDSLGRVPPLTFMPRPIVVRESTFKLCP